MKSAFEEGVVQSLHIERLLPLSNTAFMAIETLR